MSQPTLLLCTVGGTPEAVAAAVKGCQPERVIFVASPQTCEQVKTVISLTRQEQVRLSPGQYDVVQVADAQDFACCLEKMRELESEVTRWTQKGEDHRVVVDLTGGTKLMVAALALVARRWNCVFSYVGGSERTKDSVGVVMSGKEQVLHTQNPWDSLGYQAAEDAIVLFDRGDYQAAIHVLEQGSARVQRSDLKRELRTLLSLSEAYLAWDLFDHKTARNKLGDVQKNANDLRHLLPTVAGGLLSTIQEHQTFLPLFKEQTPGRHFVLDLCANARRCGDRGRWDDAVARLYRAIEATAQLELNEHGIADTGRVPLDKMPDGLQAEFVAKVKKDGTVLLALQDDYRVLAVMGEPPGLRFKELGLDDYEKSPLTARNQSILAHGFTPVSKVVFDRLWKATLKLAEIKESELVSFPRITKL